MGITKGKIMKHRRGSFIPTDIIDTDVKDEDIVFSAPKYLRFSTQNMFGQFPNVQEDNICCYKITKAHMKKAIEKMKCKLAIMERLYEKEIHR